MDIIFRIENLTEKPMLVSIEARILKKTALLGFDDKLLHKHAVKKVGTLKPFQSVEVPIRIYGDPRTRPDDYPLELKVYEHYLDYDKVLGEYRREANIRVI